MENSQKHMVVLSAAGDNWKRPVGPIFLAECLQCADIDVIPKRIKSWKLSYELKSKTLSKQQQLPKRRRWSTPGTKLKAPEPLTPSKEPKHGHPVYWGKNRGLLVK